MDFKTKNPMYIEEGVINVINNNDNNKTNEYNPYDDKFWWTPMGFWRRLKNGRLVAIFKSSSSEATVKDIDAIVNVFALLNALVLAMPISLITSLKYSDWDDFKSIAQSCTNSPANIFSSEDPYNASEYYNFEYRALADNSMCSIYCTFIGLILTVLYYVGRPSEQKIDEDAYMQHRKSVVISSPYDTIGEVLINSNFRNWWARGKYLIMIILTSTTVAIISLICAANVYYQVFFSSSSDFCTVTPQRVKNYWFAFFTLFFLILFAFYIIV